MPTSMKDVAARAGVSIKTVSNVVNGNPHVSIGTRDRVQSVIGELGYRPNLSARSLRGGRTGVIALAVPDLTYPYFAELASGVIDAAVDRGWTVLIDQTDGVRERELLVMNGIRAHLIDGIIFSPLGLLESDWESARREIPMVLIGERVVGRGTHHISIDNVAAARTATEHLLSTGRTRIGAVGHQMATSADTARQRSKGYEDAVAGAGLHVDPRLIIPVDNWHRSDGAEAIERALDAGVSFDALFCFNDLLAIGAMSALRRAGLRIPEDVAVVGIDGIDEGAYSQPALTTIALHKNELAQKSVDLLATLLGPAGVAAHEDDFQVSFELIRRGSS